ncbi:MAG: DNA polymerase ligase N-terminal domain-containing protein, partial [Cyclobacteriaceae bacterium]
MSLEAYYKKRNFKETPEPKGEFNKKNAFRFVVQRHKASRLHYDLRLELGGVLKSWAVPKGPSMNPTEKRLAIQTEDHPVAYLSFHGIIPKGNYGAGVMQIWDKGIFEGTGHLGSEEELLAQHKNGDLKITFHGNKLKGNFSLVRTRSGDKQDQWLLIKKKDEFATDLAYDAENISPETVEKDHTIPLRTAQALSPGQFIRPMLATTAKEIFDSPDWIYELKWDGYRMMAHIEYGKAKLYSRNGIDYSEKFSLITKELREIEHSVVLDGEIVIVDENGLPDFQKLQKYDPESTKGTLRYYVFDLLHLNGLDTVSLPLIERKSLLPDVLIESNQILYCEHFVGMGGVFY